MYFYRNVYISGIYWISIISTDSDCYWVDVIASLFDIYYKFLDRG